MPAPHYRKFHEYMVQVAGEYLPGTEQMLQSCLLLYNPGPKTSFFHVTQENGDLRLELGTFYNNAAIVDVILNVNGLNVILLPLRKITEVIRNETLDHLDVHFASPGPNGGVAYAAYGDQEIRQLHMFVRVIEEALTT